MSPGTGKVALSIQRKGIVDDFCAGKVGVQRHLDLRVKGVRNVHETYGSFLLRQGWYR